MLVSAVLDPSAFDSNCFDDLYRVHAEDLLEGLEKNGVLIVDLKNILEDNLAERIYSVPTQYGQLLRIYFEELLKNRNTRIVEIAVSLNGSRLSSNLLDLAYHLKTNTDADALIVSDASLEKLTSDQKKEEGIVLLSEYRNSDFEKDRRGYEKQFGPIDTRPKSEVADLIIRSIRFTKCLKFYDPYIGRNNTDDFREGIAYILSLWYEHGFFASQQGIGSVEIFTCKDRQGSIRGQYQRIHQNLITPLKQQFPWTVDFFIKEDSNRIFHARYIETEHAIIRVDRGFDLFNRNGEFKRNFFTLNMGESSHLRECRELPDANLDSTS